MRKAYYLLILLFVNYWLSAQTIRIYPNKTTLDVSETLDLTVEIRGDHTGFPTPNFPDIQGFGKTGFSRSVVMGTGGAISYTQIYAPMQVGKTYIPSFKYGTNWESAIFPRTAVTVIGSTHPQSQRGRMIDPFDAFNFPNSSNLQSVFTKKPEVFATMELSKNECFVGEALTQKVVLYIYYHDRHRVRFDPTETILDLHQNLKNPHCWQEKVDFQQIQEEVVAKNGKVYLSYTLLHNYLFPLKAGAVEYADLSVIVRPGFSPFDPYRNDPQYNKPYSVAIPKTIIKVKPLPKPPTDAPIAVGNLTLDYKLTDTVGYIGQPLQSFITLSGTTNFALLEAPLFVVDSSLENPYPLGHQTIYRTAERIYGDKKFEYSFIPSKTGYFTIPAAKIYLFNPQNQHYDTLKTTIFSIKILPTDSSKLSEQITDSETFYQNAIAQANNDLHSHPNELYRHLFWLPIGFILGYFIVIKLKHRKKETNL